jgi:hypothetical protein
MRWTGYINAAGGRPVTKSNISNAPSLIAIKPCLFKLGHWMKTKTVHR